MATVEFRHSYRSQNSEPVMIWSVAGGILWFMTSGGPLSGNPPTTALYRGSSSCYSKWIQLQPWLRAFNAVLLSYPHHQGDRRGDTVAMGGVTSLLQSTGQLFLEKLSCASAAATDNTVAQFPWQQPVAKPPGEWICAVLSWCMTVLPVLSIGTLLSWVRSFEIDSR